jgi:LL-diaminopimelate aminotransferase
MSNMTPFNPNMDMIPANYLFSDIARKVGDFTSVNPDAEIIRLGIGDAVLPIVPKVCDAAKATIDKMSKGNLGYPSGEGNSDLRKAIADVYYGFSSDIEEKNVVISSGAKEDSSNIQEIFSLDMPVYVTDPVYPVYVNSNIIAGRHDIRTLACTEENGFLPEVPDSIEKPSLIYLCFPNNPTGECADYDHLEKWVKVAKESGSVIIYDVAYRDFIVGSDIPQSIFEIEGADEVSIEIGSFSKSAGFTNIRTAWTVISDNFIGVDSDGKEEKFIDLWIRRQNYKFNGVSEIQQSMALSALTDAREDTLKQVDYYMDNANLIKEKFEEMGIECYGGVNSPYVWAKAPNNMSGWDFFDLMLNECGVVCTPGEGFGESGKGFFRLSAFAMRENVEEALERMNKLEF